MKPFKTLYVRHKYLIWPIASGIFSLIIIVLVIIPQALSTLKTKDEISSLKNKSSSLDVKAAELSNIEEISTQKNLQVTLTVLPTIQDIPKSVTILQALSRQTGLELKSTTFSSSAPKSKEGNSSFQVNLTLIGPIGLIRNFLILLQDAPQIFQVGSINVKFDKANRAATADLPISVFYEPAPKSMGSVEQPIAKLTQEEQQLLDELTKLISVGASYIEATSSATVPLGKTDPFQ